MSRELTERDGRLVAACERFAELLGHPSFALMRARLKCVDGRKGANHVSRTTAVMMLAFVDALESTLAAAHLSATPNDEPVEHWINDRTCVVVAPPSERVPEEPPKVSGNDSFVAGFREGWCAAQNRRNG